MKSINIFIFKRITVCKSFKFAISRDLESFNTRENVLVGDDFNGASDGEKGGEEG